jgi:GMC oxidoreductase
MSEDLPSLDSRVRLDGARVMLDWRPSNMAAQNGLAARMRDVLRAAGFPIVLVKPFDHPNLLVADASVLPTSAGVNPSLTVAALALRAADHVGGGRSQSMSPSAAACAPMNSSAYIPARVAATRLLIDRSSMLAVRLNDRRSIIRRRVDRVQGKQFHE